MKPNLKRKPAPAPQKSPLVPILFAVVMLIVALAVFLALRDHRPQTTAQPIAQTAPTPPVAPVATPPATPLPAASSPVRETPVANAATETLGSAAAAKPLPPIDLSTPQGMEEFRKRQMAELREQNRHRDRYPPGHYIPDEAAIQAMESNKAVVW